MNENRSRIRGTVLLVAAGAVSLVLTACSSDGDSSAGQDGRAPQSPTASAPAARGQHNAADVAFATGMIPHHRQAVEMADLAASRAGSTEVKELAAEIRKAQAPEITMLSGWLASWGEQVPAEGAVDHHSAHGMAGMMTHEEMDRLKASSGKAFDTAFLELMIKHHEGAVAMAKTEKAEGSFPAAKKMAEAIITSQTAEITRMDKYLGKS